MNSRRGKEINTTTALIPEEVRATVISALRITCKAH
jgi:hypothetical protein